MFFFLIVRDWYFAQIANLEFHFEKKLKENQKSE